MKSTTSTMRARHYSYKGKRVRSNPYTTSNVIVFITTFAIAMCLFIGLGANANSNSIDDVAETDYNSGTYLSYAKAEKIVPAIIPEQELPVLESTSDIDTSGLEESFELKADLVSNSPPPEPEPTPQEIMQQCLGETSIETSNCVLTMYDLPTKYYPNLDFSSFQAWMPYTVITDRTSQAYKVISDDRMYIDENGMCRFQTTDDQFTIDGKDDYVIALGTYYKPKGTCGDRWLVITTTGAYTAITGDEKADCDTDDLNMFTMMNNGSCAGIIEWLVDTPTLNRDIKYHGTVTRGPIEELQGEILFIYRIE